MIYHRGEDSTERTLGRHDASAGFSQMKRSFPGKREESDIPGKGTPGAKA